MPWEAVGSSATPQICCSLEEVWGRVWRPGLYSEHLRASIRKQREQTHEYTRDGLGARLLHWALV